MKIYSGEGADAPEAPEAEFDHKAHMAKIEKGLNTAISLINSNQPQKAVKVLMGLKSEEEKEEAVEGEVPSRKEQFNAKLDAMLG